MNHQKVEQVLQVILDRYGADILGGRPKAKAAVLDLLPAINYPGEQLVLRNAMESDAFWIFLATSSITSDAAERTVEQLKKERRMIEEDAEFIVRCVAMARGFNSDIVAGNKIRRQEEEGWRCKEKERKKQEEERKRQEEGRKNQGYIGKSIAANYFRGVEAVGGKIYFDSTGFTFKSHAFNLQRGETRIEYSQMRDIRKTNTLGLVPNGISVFTKDGFEHKFVINNRSKVIAFLENFIQPNP